MTDSHIYVTYTVRQGATAGLPRSTTVAVPHDIHPKDIPGFVMRQIRPDRAPDPSDNYAGQSSDELVLLNMVKLEGLK